MMPATNIKDRRKSSINSGTGSSGTQKLSHNSDSNNADFDVNEEENFFEQAK